ncbi:MAG: hypothetical protein M3443_07915 [Actinomycetota bacterium]|nr:hypothetical protein [Actinomycetota bacterium]
MPDIPTSGLAITCTFALIGVLVFAAVFDRRPSRRAAAFAVLQLLLRRDNTNPTPEKPTDTPDTDDPNAGAGAGNTPVPTRPHQ